MRLVIAPHADDEVLGCSSVLDENTFVYYAGVNDFHIVSKKQRIEEVKSVSKYFKFGCHCGINPVDNYTTQDILNSVQELINLFVPEEIYLPHPSYNQDHKAVYQACFAALRLHDSNYFVKKVFVYEQVHNNLWDDSTFKPTYYRKLDIKKKLEGYKLHKSQVRKHRSCEMITTLGKMRGFQSSQPYAEAFEVLRWVD